MDFRAYYHFPHKDTFSRVGSHMSDRVGGWFSSGGIRLGLWLLSFIFSYVLTGPFPNFPAIVRIWHYLVLGFVAFSGSLIEISLFMSWSTCVS